MSLRWAIWITVIFMALMTIITPVMYHRALIWVDQGVYIPLYERVLFQLAAMWGHTWWWLSLQMFAVLLSIAGITDVISVIRHRRS